MSICDWLVQPLLIREFPLSFVLLLKFTLALIFEMKLVVELETTICKELTVVFAVFFVDKVRVGDSVETFEKKYS